ncbi:MAG: HEAT repeat domain-containing protein [Sedimentisphaerales bacterium]|nr:HEAT repeat domain-containing protein [Sedimentisphaerales bacterium]
MLIKKRYFSWFVILIIVAVSTGIVAQDRPAANFKQSDLIAVLQSDAPKGEKAITCKRLTIYGTEESVPALAPLLADKELASWARIALEAIPGPAADAALRDALGKLDGRLLVGVINSIGVRCDFNAVDALVKKLDDTNADVASAAAVALGHIGGEQAAKALTQSLTNAPAGVRSAVAEGCILCAEWFLAHDMTAEAVKLYDTVRHADVPDQRHLEAIRGAILARRSAGVPLLIEQLRSEDKERLGVGLRTARELPGRDVTEALAAEMARLSPDRRPLLLLALADRSDSAVLPTVHKAAQNGPKDLRITAINILIRLGDVTCVPVLLEAAIEDDAMLEQAATETLIRLPGNDVDADLLARLPQAQGRLQQLLIELVGQRQISKALPAVVSSLHDTDANIRGAAVRTVGIIGQDRQTADLVKLLQETSSSSERSDIEKALLAISGRCGARCIPHLQPLTWSRDSGLHMIGLHALAIIGGSDALAAVKSAIESAEPPVQDEAVRILSTWPNNWPEDGDAGQALLMLATSAEKMSHQVLGLRGYLQYIRGNKKLSNERKVAKIKDVWPHIKRPEERRQAVAVLAEAPIASALELLTTLTDDPAVAEEVYSAMVRIAGQDIPGVSKDHRRGVLETVAEKSSNNSTKQRAQKILSGIR